MQPQPFYTFYRVQNDTQPNLGFYVYRKPDPGSPPGTKPSLVDLTPYTGSGNSATLTIQSQSTSTLTNTGHTACAVSAPTTGLAVYVLQSGDLPDAANGAEYLCDLTLTNSSGPETLYGYVKIVTRPRV